MTGPVAELRDSVMLHRFLSAASDANPEGVALTFSGRSYTYAELDERANAVAQRLIAGALGAAGTVSRQRVAVVISTGPEWMICTQAGLRTGAAVITPMATWTLTELSHALDLTTPDCIIAETLSAGTL